MHDPSRAGSSLRGISPHIVVVLLQCAVGWIFLAAGVAKQLGDGGSLRAMILACGVPPGWIERALTGTIPLVEIAVGMWLVIGARPRTATWACLCLTVAFSGVLYAAGVRIGWDRECPCAVLGPATIKFALWRNVVIAMSLVAVAAVLARLPPINEHPSRSDQPGPDDSAPRQIGST